MAVPIHTLTIDANSPLKIDGKPLPYSQAVLTLTPCVGEFSIQMNSHVSFSGGKFAVPINATHCLESNFRYDAESAGIS